MSDDFDYEEGKAKFCPSCYYAQIHTKHSNALCDKHRED